MSSKDAEIERAFERAEKDEERAFKQGEIGHDATAMVAGAVFDYPILIWADPTPCPRCGKLASLKMKPGKRWLEVCLPCNRYWPLVGDEVPA